MSLQRSRELTRWRGMLYRCENPRDKGYRYYGARGIRVCERWHDFEAYYADIMRLLGPCPDGKSLDRINNDGHYEPSNVRWATPKEQARNSRAIGPQPLRPRKPSAGCVPPFLRPAEVCGALGITRGKLQRLIDAGELDAFRLSPGRQYRVSEPSVEEYIARLLPEGEAS